MGKLRSVLLAMPVWWWQALWHVLLTGDGQEGCSCSDCIDPMWNGWKRSTVFSIAFRDFFGLLLQQACWDFLVAGALFTTLCSFLDLLVVPQQSPDSHPDLYNNEELPSVSRDGVLQSGIVIISAVLLQAFSTSPCHRRPGSGSNQQTKVLYDMTTRHKDIEILFRTRTNTKKEK